MNIDRLIQRLRQDSFFYIRIMPFWLFSSLLMFGKHWVAIKAYMSSKRFENFAISGRLDVFLNGVNSTCHVTSFLLFVV